MVIVQSYAPTYYHAIEDGRSKLLGYPISKQNVLQLDLHIKFIQIALYIVLNQSKKSFYHMNMIFLKFAQKKIRYTVSHLFEYAY